VCVCLAQSWGEVKKLTEIWYKWATFVPEELYLDPQQIEPYYTRSGFKFKVIAAHILVLSHEISLRISNI
jgi:hypothetical protein